MAKVAAVYAQCENAVDAEIVPIGAVRLLNEGHRLSFNC